MSITSCLFNNVVPFSYHEIHIQQMSYISRNLLQVGSNLNLNLNLNFKLKKKN